MRVGSGEWREWKTPRDCGRGEMNACGFAPILVKARYTRSHALHGNKQ